MSATAGWSQVLRGQVDRALGVLHRDGIGLLMAKLLNAPRNFTQISQCRKQLRNLRRDSSVENLVDFVLSSGVVAPIQIRSELAQLVSTVKKARPRVVVEIGTASGGTLLLLCCVADRSATIASIDLLEGRFGGGYSAFRIPLYRDFAAKPQQMHLIRGDSHQKSTFDTLCTSLSGQSIDFLFIDGDHTYEGVRRDFELYSPLVSKGGMIGFHDIAPNSPESDYGVPRFWSEVKSNYSWQEIIADRNQTGYGIGLLVK